MIDLKGFGTEGFLGVAAYLIYKDMIKPRYRLWKDKANGRNPNGNVPGKADACIKHIKQLAIIETKIDDIKEDIRNIKDKNA